MTIDKIQLKDAAIRPIAPRLHGVHGAETTQTGPKNFGEMFTDAVKEVDGLHHTAEKKVEDLVRGKDSSPHDAMIALEKADAAFQLMTQVRQKIIRAYEDLIRTQV